MWKWVWPVCFFTCLAVGAQSTSSHCRVYEGNLRVDSPEAVKTLQSICELHGNVGIFTDGIQQLDFPNLRSAQLINIEAYGLKAISFSHLRSVSYLYISGPDLEIAEFPSLRAVSDTFHVQSRRLKYLNLPQLGRVDGLFSVTGNPSLQFIFADDLYSVGELQIANDPELTAGTAEALQLATRVLTPEEQKTLDEQREDAREFQKEVWEHLINQPPMAPTGHPTYFNTFQNYYAWYPREYWDYWQAIGPWGYWGFYGY